MHVFPQCCCVKFSTEFSERDLFRLACNACWEILECVEWGTVVQLSGRSEQKRNPMCRHCLSVSITAPLPLSTPIFQLFLSFCKFWATFLTPVGRRRLEVNKIKKSKTSAFHYIHKTQRSVSGDGRELEMWFSFLFSTEGLLCFIKLRLMFVQCHWNRSRGKD